jgi:uncharacterized protein
LIAGRYCFFKNLTTKRHLLWRGLLISLGVLLLLNLMKIGMLQLPFIQQQNVQVFLTMCLNDVTNLLKSASYVFVFLLLFSWSKGRKCLQFFIPIGCMALTNYILQSLIGAALFFGCGGGLLGKIGTSATLFLGIGISIGQWFFSHWWLTCFSIGPLEWLWRTTSLYIYHSTNSIYLTRGVDTEGGIFSEKIIKQ